MRYELIICWSKTDDSFVVEIPELPGCMADGAIYEEAVANERSLRNGLERRSRSDARFPSRAVNCRMPDRRRSLLRTLDETVQSA